MPKGLNIAASAALIAQGVVGPQNNLPANNAVVVPRN
jgi:hypothetical protein